MQGPSKPTPSLPNSPLLTDIQSSIPSDFTVMYPLNLDYDPYLVPKTNMHYVTKESRHAQHQHAQAAWWNQTILPALIRPFMHWKHKWSSAWPMSQGGIIVEMCPCTGHHQILKVVCVKIKGMLTVNHSLIIPLCSCFILCYSSPQHWTCSLP
jgi:hypothetical protein